MAFCPPRLTRLLALPLVAALTLPAYAGDPVPAAPAAAPAAPAAAAPKIADDAAATAAVATFKEAWKAKGLKGDERMAQRDWALSELAKVQHPLVVAELGDVARSGDGTLRTLAVIYLGDQKALPALAGEQVLIAFKKNADDTVLLLSALQSLSALKYLGGDQLLKDLLNSEDYVIRKAAITTVGQLGDTRLLDELLKILGVDPKAPPPTGGEEEKKGGKEVVEEGYSWEGAEAVVDHGDADNTKENAEAKAKAESQIAQNKAAAAGKSGGGGGGGGGDGGTGGGRGGAARSKDELKPYVLKALRSLTGETFMNSREIRSWLGAHGEEVVDAKSKCEATEVAQRAAAKK
jgi:HEAT repeat protein